MGRSTSPTCALKRIVRDCSRPGRDDSRRPARDCGHRPSTPRAVPPPRPTSRGKEECEAYEKLLKAAAELKQPIEAATAKKPIQEKNPPQDETAAGTAREATRRRRRKDGRDLTTEEADEAGTAEEARRHQTQRTGRAGWSARRRCQSSRRSLTHACSAVHWPLRTAGGRKEDRAQAEDPDGRRSDQHGRVLHKPGD